MQFDPPLRSARLVRRYKRFLADVILPDGSPATAHCPNPGSMLGLAEPGAAIMLQPARGPARRLPWSWKLVALPGGHWAGIDTGLPNRLVARALAARAIPGLDRHERVRAEVRYDAGSRVDFLLTGGGQPDTYVEVKNVHLRRGDPVAEFPDCVTARGRKHLQALARMVALGHRAVMVYIIQRTDCSAFRLAADIDPAYAAAFRAARAAGVEALALATGITPEGVHLAGSVPVLEGPE